MQLALSIREASTLTAALRVAAVEYGRDAATCKAPPGHDRVAELFERQAAEALELADRIDELD